MAHLRGGGSQIVYDIGGQHDVIPAVARRDVLGQWLQRPARLGTAGLPKIATLRDHCGDGLGPEPELCGELACLFVSGIRAKNSAPQPDPIVEFELVEMQDRYVNGD